MRGASTVGADRESPPDVGACARHGHAGPPDAVGSCIAVTRSVSRSVLMGSALSYGTAFVGVQAQIGARHGWSWLRSLDTAWHERRLGRGRVRPGSRRLLWTESAVLGMKPVGLGKVQGRAIVSVLGAAFL